MSITIRLVGGCLCALLATSCRKDTSNATDNTTRTTSATTELTPIDQGNDKTDIDVTAQIRRQLVGDDALSTDAKNIKVITEGGVVTLRGLVKDESEKVMVESKAAQVAGVKRIENDLDVAGPR
jgi:osmotically-inducible protein OsmY